MPEALLPKCSFYLDNSGQKKVITAKD